MKILNSSQNHYIAQVIKNMKKRILILSYIFLTILLGCIHYLISALLILAPFLLLYINKMVKRTNWWNNRYLYTQQYLPAPLFRKNLTRNYDLINLGSQSSLFAFDYKNICKGLNLSSGIQSLPQDFELLKYYHSYLKKHGTVIIPISPFSSVFKTNYDTEYYTRFIKDFPQTEKKIYGDYYANVIHYLSPTQIPNYSSVLKHVKYPIIYTTKSAIKSLIKDSPFDSRLSLDRQELSKEQLEKDAIKWIEGWKSQFNLDNLDSPLPDHIKEGRKKRVEILKQMIEFCNERGYKTIIILPPVTKHLSNKMSETFRHNYIYSFLEEVNLCNTPFLNYLDDNRFQDEDFFNSFFLNRNGAKKFTQIVYNEIIKAHSNNLNI